MRLALLLFALLTVFGCTEPTAWAPDDKIDAMRYLHPGGGTVTLVTVSNVGSGSGAHSALIVNASERVIFDPAGSMKHESLAERGDVLYGANPALVDSFIDYHTRSEFYTQVQTVDVPLQVAEDLLERIKSNGAVYQSFCAQSVSRLLRQPPGFENISATFFPGKLSESFTNRALVRAVTFYQLDDTNKRANSYAWLGQKPMFNIE